MMLFLPGNGSGKLLTLILNHAKKNNRTAFIIKFRQKYNCTDKKKAIVKRATKEYFDINKYKDWETDSTFSLHENYKFLKKRNERIEINFYEDGIKVSLKNINLPYEIVKAFYKSTKRLFIEGIYFYQFPIGIDKYYNENGKFIGEFDFDKSFKFSVKKLIQKF